MHTTPLTTWRQPGVNHVVVPYTVLQEVRHRNMGIYSRLRALCRVETGAMVRRDPWVAPHGPGLALFPGKS